MVELHTGLYSNLAGPARDAELARLAAAAAAAHAAGHQVNAGHGLNYDNLPAFLAAVPHLDTLNIGHSIVARAVFTGLRAAVRALKDLLPR
jgi:pyridoxine 5-phosphate synthase